LTEEGLERGRAIAARLFGGSAQAEPKTDSDT
jgi:hypothetical protein